jgi:MFS family permease
MGRVWRTWVVLLFFAMGTSLITPLIPLYQQDLGFNDTVVTLFLLCYVVALVPSMLTLGQFSDQIGRRPVLLGAIGTLAVAQVIILSEPGLAGLLIARGLQGAATGAFFGTCTAFLVDASPEGKRRFSSALATISVRLGLGLGPGICGVLIQYAPEPFRLPFAAHLVLLAIASPAALAQFRVPQGGTESRLSVAPVVPPAAPGASSSAPTSTFAIPAPAASTPSSEPDGRQPLSVRSFATTIQERRHAAPVTDRACIEQLFYNFFSHLVSIDERTRRGVQERRCQSRV